ncbi:MAG: helix-turn-helix domain-containing protein [Gammaproteobacteria bacterium]|nr:helix-turn-helix domain-containing protein [Gammaproteobacteria bacterium]
MQAKLRAKLKSHMRKKRHNQKDVEAITGVSQPLISRALNGDWKVLSPKIKILCDYCGLAIKKDIDPKSSKKLMKAIEKVWDGSKRQEAAIASVIENVGAFIK